MPFFSDPRNLAGEGDLEPLFVTGNSGFKPSCSNSPAGVGEGDLEALLSRSCLTGVMPSCSGRSGCTGDAFLLSLACAADGDLEAFILLLDCAGDGDLEAF